MMKKFAVLPFAALAFAAACSDTNQNPFATPDGPLFHEGENFKLTTPVANSVITSSTAAPWAVTINWTASTSPSAHDRVGAYQFILRQRTSEGWVVLQRTNDHDAATTSRAVVLATDGTYVVTLRGLAAKSNSHNSRRRAACFIVGSSNVACPTDASEIPGDSDDPNDDDGLPVILDPAPPAVSDGPTAQFITFDALGNKTYGDATFEVSATASSGLAVTFSSRTTDQCTVTSGVVTILKVGTCTIRASQNGGDNNSITYSAAPVVDRSFTIAQKVASVTPNSASKIFGEVDPTLTGTLAGFLDADGVTASYSRETGQTVGTYAISAGLNAAEGVLANYDVTYNTATFTIRAWSTVDPVTGLGFGFYQPVGVENSIHTAPGAAAPSVATNPKWNIVRGGNTVPLKFNVWAGNTEVTDPNKVKFTAVQLATCSGGTEQPLDASTLSTGGTSLRYSGTSGVDGQFVQNWATPRVTGANICYRATATMADGSAIHAFFQVRK